MNIRPVVLITMLVVAVGIASRGADAVSADSPHAGVHLHYHMQASGTQGGHTGVLSLWNGGTSLATWAAGSGDNVITNQCQRWDKNDNSPWGGPIPAGQYSIHPIPTPSPQPTPTPGFRYPHPDGSYGTTAGYPLSASGICGGRYGFFIHAKGTTHGCIDTDSGLFAAFRSTMDSYFKTPSNITIPLYVSYGGVPPGGNPPQAEAEFVATLADDGECASSCSTACGGGGVGGVTFEVRPVDIGESAASASGYPLALPIILGSVAAAVAIFCAVGCRRHRGSR